jgi:hypothetical protein
MLFIFEIWVRLNLYFNIITNFEGVDNTTQAKLIPNSLFNALFDGFIQTFIYELVDETWYETLLYSKELFNWISRIEDRRRIFISDYYYYYTLSIIYFRDD